jgi:CheY-like chemotaxis protein
MDGDAPPAHGPSRPLEGIRVMVVEDEPDALDLLERVLREAGAEVVASRSAEDALERFRGKTVDILVSDIGMPGMDGCELIRHVRAFPDDARARVPAIAVSAYARTEDGERALAAGYQRYIAKPVDVAALIGAIAALTRP